MFFFSTFLSFVLGKECAKDGKKDENSLTNYTEAPYLRARDVDSVLATSHASNLTGITIDSDPSVLFSGNNSCILTPEVTQGPYWVQGELVRGDITEEGEGVPLTLDIQIIDVNTCEPVPQASLEIWHCNSTGVYSGVVANGNGNSDDTSNLNKTFLRGIQQSDQDGVVTFHTLFPGHYTGRATHIHVMTSQNATVNANKTLSGGSVTHVGQMFFDQDLISLVEKTEPYASNTQGLTENADDSILAEEAGTVDPMIEYVLLGEDVSEGIFGWLAFGMDTTNSFNITPAAYLTENGGVTNENAGSGMAGGPPGGNGTAPSGLMPSNAIPSNLSVSSTLSTTVVSSSTATSSKANTLKSGPSHIALPASPQPKSSFPAGGSRPNTAPQGAQSNNGQPWNAHGQPSDYQQKSNHHN